jgi:hypothetical protein
VRQGLPKRASKILALPIPLGLRGVQPVSANRGSRERDAILVRLRRHSDFALASFLVARETARMKNYTKILFSILAAAICSAGVAAEPQSCKKTGKNCPMNDNKKCNCGKNCSC